MKKQTERLVLGGLCALALLSVALDRFPLPDAQARLERLPASGPGFSMQPLPISDAERAVFGKATLFRRMVTLEKRHFVLTVIDGTANRHALHDPVYCIRGAGYTVERSESLAIPAGTIQRLTLERQGKRRELLYYFSSGQKRYTSPITCWLAGVLRRLSLGSSGPAPVLVELEPIEAGLSPEKVFLQIPGFDQL